MKSDAEFLHALQGSQAHVSAVAGWLATKNFDVLIRPTTVRPDFDSRNDYADCGDIELRQRVEVKQRDLDFTCVQDFPYPTVIVDEKFKVDRIPKPHLWGYLIMNRALTHLCCIRSGTRPQWTVENKYDHKDGQTREFYVCRKELCAFYRMG